MVYEKDSKYYRICDDCGNTIEIKKQAYLKNCMKSKHYCRSCSQRGERNHCFGKPSWNKGLNKNNDERVKKYGEKCSKTKQGSIPWNKNCTYEELKGKEWADNFKKKLSDSKKGNPNYKRRKSTNRDKSWKYFRKLCKSVLYSSWVRPIMERDNFKCQNCGTKRDLEVHHIKPFRMILLEASQKEHLNLNDFHSFTDEEFERLRNTIVEMHTLNDGITLCKNCHKMVDVYRRKFDE